MAAAVASDATQMHFLLASREYLYTFFHKAFGGVPNAELLATACGDDVAVALGAFAEESEQLKRAGDFLKSFAARDVEQTLDSMKDEYTRMFVGPAHLAAYPWEAPYVTHNAASCQESTVLVREAYRMQGLEPRKLLRVPDDHVSIMCAFLAELGRRSFAVALPLSPVDLARQLRVQEAFIAKHVRNWVDEYAAAARRSKTAVFYPQAIEAFAEFTKVDAVFLSEAAFWAESLQGQPCDFKDSQGDAIAEASTKLASLELFGIEDNELVEI